jgi:hypothetical protein
MKELLLTIIRRQDFGWRILIMFFSILIATSIYTFIVDFYDPESNVILSITRRFQKKNKTFFSGSPGGFYTSIGKALHDELDKNSYSISITNEATAGGYENAIKVLATPSSFGLVQENTLRKNDFIRKHINYVTPLYMERMHILYRYDKLKNKLKIKKQPNIIISSKLNRDTVHFFSNARISTGPVGSSGRIIASYILNHINNNLNLQATVENTSKTVAYKTEKGLNELTKKMVI